MQWPLVGREAELDTIRDMLADAASGGVVITGPAGVGKTRLATEASALADARSEPVIWIRATRAARALPLGAFAAVMPPTTATPGVELLALARHSLRERAAGRRLVLCVDDGHLLDDASAALVHQVAAAREAFVVVTLRRDAGAPDALAALWKDELCERIGLRELGREAVERLLDEMLGGPVERRSANALWELTRGNVQFLRELLRYGRDHGLLVDAGGVWRWSGAAIAAGTRIAELVDLRLGDLDAATDAERVALAIALARNRFCGLGRAAEAEAGLREAEAAVADRVLRDELVGQRIRLASASGRPREALAAARSLLDDPGARDQARLQAALGAVEALMVSGRSDEALAVADRWLPVARRARDPLPLLELVPVIELVLTSERAIALRLAGRLVEATDSSEALYRRAVIEQASGQNGAVEASSLGYMWLARGRPRTAMRLFRESAGLLRQADAVGMLALALAGIVQAAAQVGDVETAVLTRAELARRPLGHKTFEPELGIAEAWAAAARGELSRAVPLALGAAELARDRGQLALEARALHEATRLGGARQAAARLAALAAEVDGEFADAAAEHAAGVAAGDGPRVLAAAERFAAMDALLVAAEAAQAASVAFAAAGRAASARSAAARGRTWLARCEGARPVTVVGAAVADELTAREREIALLAAGGLRSRDIAERLVVSVRTVDNHLQRAYRKLGVSRREELGDVLH